MTLGATIALAAVPALLYLVLRRSLPVRPTGLRWSAVAVMLALGAYSLAVDGRPYVLLLGVALAIYEATAGRRRPT